MRTYNPDRYNYHTVHVTPRRPGDFSSKPFRHLDAQRPKDKKAVQKRKVAGPKKASVRKG